MKRLKLLLFSLLMGVSIVSNAQNQNSNTIGTKGSATTLTKISGPFFLSLGEPLIVNLQRESSDQYLQADITLSLANGDIEQSVSAKLPLIRTKLLFLLSSKKPSELLSAEKMRTLVFEIISETESVIGSKGVLDVFFNSFIIQ